MLRSRLLVAFAGLWAFACMASGRPEGAIPRADLPEATFQARWPTLSPREQMAEVARLAEARAAGSLRWIALEMDNPAMERRDPGPMDKPTMTWRDAGPDAVRAHAECASPAEHVALCRRLRFEQPLWRVAFFGCFEERDPVAIAYIIEVTPRMGATMRAYAYMCCQSCKWPDLLGCAVRDHSSEEVPGITNGFVRTTLGDIANSYVKSFDPPGRK